MSTKKIPFSSRFSDDPDEDSSTPSPTRHVNDGSNKAALLMDSDREREIEQKHQHDLDSQYSQVNHQEDEDGSDSGSPSVPSSSFSSSSSSSSVSHTLTPLNAPHLFDAHTQIPLSALNLFRRYGITKQFGPPVVTITNLSKSYSLPGREEVVSALKRIDLSPANDFYPILQGEFVMIRGPSGGGKTTLLNILGTIDECTTGSIELLGQEVNSSSSDAYLAALRLKKIGFVFQTFNLLATMSAFENVELPMTILGKLSTKECKVRAMELLDLVGLQDRYGHLPSELSGGEQQRVTIARALSNEPQLLLLDEPTGDLDTRNTVDVMDLILKVNLEQKTTCVMVTHNPDLECYADRILYVEDGQFKKQAINKRQVKLDYAEYMHYINKQNNVLS